MLGKNFSVVSTQKSQKTICLVRCLFTYVLLLMFRKKWPLHALWSYIMEPKSRKALGKI